MPDVKPSTTQRKPIRRSIWTAIQTRPKSCRGLSCVSGVYVLYSGGSVVCVGQSACIVDRLYCHALRFHFDSAKACAVPDKMQRRWLERKLLFRLRPKKNSVVPSVLRLSWPVQFAEMR